MTRFEGWGLIGVCSLLVLLIVVSSNPVVFDASNPKDSDGNLKVRVEHGIAPIVDLKLSSFINDINLSADYIFDDVIINVSSATLPSVHDIVRLYEGNHFYQGHIINVTSLGGSNYSLRMDSPSDFNFSNDGNHSLRDGNWAVDGSNNSVIFALTPFGLNDSMTWHINRVMLTCIGDGISGADPEPDLTSFFVTDAITNGIVFRIIDGLNQNIFTVYDNFHLVGETFNLVFYDASKFGLYGMTSRRTFNGLEKNGVAIVLDASDQDAFQLIIQDDLTDMDLCHAVAQGHVELG